MNNFKTWTGINLVTAQSHACTLRLLVYLPVHVPITKRRQDEQHVALHLDVDSILLHWLHRRHHVEDACITAQTIMIYAGTQSPETQTKVKLSSVAKDIACGCCGKSECPYRSIDGLRLGPLSLEEQHYVWWKPYFAKFSDNAAFEISCFPGLLDQTDCSLGHQSRQNLRGRSVWRLRDFSHICHPPVWRLIGMFTQN